MSANLLPDPLSHRTADWPIDRLFLKRWSPRAMSGAPLADAELNTLFEAARWAPSTYNEQEWRFVFARQGTGAFQTLFGFLAEANQSWCDRAAVLVVVCSRKTFVKNGKDNPVHTFDTGAAFQNLSLQGARMDLVVHGMAGFDRDKARQELQIPEAFDVEAMIAIGRPGDPADLPEKYRELEKPSGRKPLSEIVREGSFSFEQ